MSSYHGAQWSPSEWYKYQSTPTQRKLIKRHIEGKHTQYCMTYDVHYGGEYCKWLGSVFWPRIYFTTDIQEAILRKDND